MAIKFTITQTGNNNVLNILQDDDNLIIGTDLSSNR